MPNYTLNLTLSNLQVKIKLLAQNHVMIAFRHHTKAIKYTDTTEHLSMYLSIYPFFYLSRRSGWCVNNFDSGFPPGELCVVFQL